MQCDVSDTEQVQQHLEESVSVFGGVDVLFNNAGIVGGIGPLESVDEKTFEDLFRVNEKKRLAWDAICQVDHGGAWWWRHHKYCIGSGFNSEPNINGVWSEQARCCWHD